MLFAQIAPESSKDVLILPVFLSIFGALFWWMGMRSIEAGGKGWARLFGGLFLGLALFNALQRLWDMYSPQSGFIYRAMLTTKMYVSHLIAFLIPLIIICVIVLTAMLRRRRLLDEQ